MGDAGWLVGVLVTGAGTVAAGGGVPVSAALVGVVMVGAGPAWGPFPQAAASSDQAIANSIRVQRSLVAFCKEVVPSKLV